MISHPPGLSTQLASVRNRERLNQWRARATVTRRKEPSAKGKSSAEASTYCTPASRGARSSISREVSVPTTLEATSVKAKVDCPVPQATSRAQGTGSWSFRKTPIFFITNGWKQGRLLAYRSAEFRDSK